MHSTELEKILKKKAISIGDRVSVSRPEGGKIEGMLLPTLLDDEGKPSNTLVLKLDNGYNAGVQVDGDAIVEKILQKTTGALDKTPKRHFEKKEGLPKISMIATGGTIASRADYKLGGVKAVLSPEEIFYNMPELAEIASFEKISRPFTLMSENMTPREWQKIAEEATRELNSEAAGVIITHGTDTLHYTSAALSFMIKDLNKPVALLGAQRSPDRGSFDGAMNLACASHFVASSGMAEVAIVMHATTNDDYCIAIRGTKARKMHTSRRDAFRPVNDAPLAKIWPDGKIEKIRAARAVRPDAKAVADAKFEEKVALIKVYPGAPPELLDFFVDKKYRGIVVDATGLGHAPTHTLDKRFSWTESIKSAVEKGVVVAYTAQTLYGRLSPFVYEPLRLLRQIGGVHCEDILPEVAYVKLGWLLGHKMPIEEVKKKMLENIAGEINPRHAEKDFLA